jgi:hypothetical protein
MLTLTEDPLMIPVVGVAETRYGVVEGVTAEDADEATLSPTSEVAFTENVYAVPLVSPVTLQLVVAEVQVAPPGAAVTVYPVTADVPAEAGAVHDTTDSVFP